MADTTPAAPPLTFPDIPVLHQGRSCAVIDKPAGVAVESDGPDCVVKRLARQLAPKGGRAWPRVVHRLDTGTSGCLAIALNQHGEKALTEGFLQGEIDKEYFALVRGELPETGRFDMADGPDPKDARRHTTRLETPRRARLSWKRVEQFADAALVRVVLDTGRTHQIRVQFAEGGFPVLGDAVYGLAGEKGGVAGEPPSRDPLEARLALTRPALHAASLSLPDPDGNGLDRIVAEAPLPEDLLRVLALLRASR